MLRDAEQSASRIEAYRAFRIFGNNKERRMPETSTATSPGQELSRGLDIEYKAFARSFQPDGTAAVLYLIATCYYKTSGFTIFIEEDSGQFNLMEQPPTGIFRDIVTYYDASWTNV